MKYSTLFLCFIALLLTSCMAEIQFNRFWLVDTRTRGTYTNYLYRGNLPVTNDEFAYEEMIKYANVRADEKGVERPFKPYIVDISLLTVDQHQGEIDFFDRTENVDKGMYINWPLGISGLVPPAQYPEPERRRMANSTVWDFDKLPERLGLLYDIMNTPGPIDPETGRHRSKLVYGHCAAGVDRTGQLMLGWRLYTMPSSKLSPSTIHDLYELNTQEAGRCPNYYSTTGSEWFCVWYSMNMNDFDIGNCLHLADCKPFGHCCR